MAAAMVCVSGKTGEQTGAIHEWVRNQTGSQLEGRLTMAFRAIEIVNDIDNKQKDIIDKVRLEADRVSQIVTDCNVVRAELETTFADIRSKMSMLFEETKVFANQTVETAGGMDAKVNELHAKTKLFADQTVAEIVSIKGSLTTESERFQLGKSGRTKKQIFLFIKHIISENNKKSASKGQQCVHTGSGQ